MLINRCAVLHSNGSFFAICRSVSPYCSWAAIRLVLCLLFIEKLKANVAEFDNLSWIALNTPRREKLAAAAGKLREAVADLVDLTRTKEIEQAIRLLKLH